MYHSDVKVSANRYPINVSVSLGVLLQQQPTECGSGIWDMYIPKGRKSDGLEPAYILRLAWHKVSVNEVEGYSYRATISGSTVQDIRIGWGYLSALRGQVRSPKLVAHPHSWIISISQQIDLHIFDSDRKQLCVKLTSNRAVSVRFQLSYCLQCLLDYDFGKITLNPMSSPWHHEGSNAREILERFDSKSHADCRICNQGCHVPLLRQLVEIIEKASWLVFLRKKKWS